MKETRGKECEESRVEDRGSCRLNEMKERCESGRGGDEVYPATFGNEEKSGLKLDDDDGHCIQSIEKKTSKSIVRLSL